MKEIEYEVRYLAKYLPQGLKEVDFLTIHDVYFPASVVHPDLRLRQKGDKYEITKKSMLQPDDRSSLQEINIELTTEEFNALSKASGKEIVKVRYKYPYNGRTAEINVFEEKLKGLVMVEFEFPNKKELDKFEMPEFCLADVTQVETFAGGILAGKSFSDLAGSLKSYGYSEIL